MIAAGNPANIFMDLFMSRFLGQVYTLPKNHRRYIKVFHVFLPQCAVRFSQSTGHLTNGNFKSSVSVLARPVVTFRSTDLKVIGI